ncbi:peptidoglycan-binding domain-containing protein [Streptomyces sp. NPDC001034]|uniref:peptidoglycan-binding domain-containing protein n=1 Tax=Streptomyces sp. NPDC001034 TaxID=3154375 RepID=UPI00332F37FB
MAEQPRRQSAADRGAELSAQLRRWWEAAGRERDGKPPAQESLARRVGVAQTTLSRYLNPGHRSTAPVEVVRGLHAALEAPEEELERALELARGAADPGGAPTGDGRESAHPRPAGPHPRTAGPDPRAAGPDPRTGAQDPRTGAPETRRPRPPRRFPRLRRPAVYVALALALFWLGRESARLIPPAVGRSSAAPAAGAPVATDVREAWPTVRPGDRGTLVWTVQRLLKAHRVPITVNGVFDDATGDRVRAFQHDSGLQPDALVGVRTWSMLIKDTAPGDAGPQVEAVQDLLARAGWPADITGRFTMATHQSLLDFQRAHGLPPTGTADRATWLALTAARPRP